MKKYINITFIFISLILTLPAYSQSNHDNNVLDKVVGNFEESNGVNANFHINSETNGYVSIIKGAISIKDRMFYFVTDEMECGYDGSILWSYIRNNNEINITSPDEEEIISINPYLLLKNYSNRFKCSTKTSNESSEIVSLLPKNTDDNISFVNVTINKKLLYPSKIEITNRDKTKIVINVSNYKYINLDNSKFEFNEKQYPNIEIIDLR